MMEELSKSGDRPATKPDEIEIIPAMIQAGVAELFFYDHEVDSASDTVERIIRAALATLPPGFRGISCELYKSESY